MTNAAQSVPLSAVPRFLPWACVRTNHSHHYPSNVRVNDCALTLTVRLFLSGNHHFFSGVQRVCTFGANAQKDWGKEKTSFVSVGAGRFGRTRTNTAPSESALAKLK
jgi:hypothetical protein